MTTAASFKTFSREFVGTLTHPTPFFCFDLERIEEKYAEFQQCFPGAEIRYALKANSEPEILSLLNRLGCGFEAASMYELQMLEAVGVPAERIIYGTSVKPASHIKAFHDYGVDCFAFDTFQELEKIAAIAPSARVYVRTIANDAGSVFKLSEKFGTERENIVPLLRRAVELGLKPYGISFNVGSQASNPKAWAHAVESLCPTLLELEAAGIRVEVINLGGGYPCQYASSGEIALAEIASHTLEECAKLPYVPKLMLEPGRAMVADSGILVTSVVERIDRRGYTWLFLDAGVYNALFETMAYQGSTRYPISSLRPPHDAGEAIFALAGPTGDGPDVITKEALLPQDVSVGDKLIIHNVGAYSLVNASPFNGFPRPDVHFVDKR